MTMFKLEEDLRDPVTFLFKTRDYSTYDEVRLISRDIDLVAKRNNTVVSIELKMRKWRKAIQQACLDLRVSNYAYIALPESRFENFNRELFYDAWKMGIGIISVDGSAKIMMKPQKSTRIQPILRKGFLKSLRER